MDAILWFAMGAAAMLSFIATFVLIDEHRARRRGPRQNDFWHYEG